MQKEVKMSKVAVVYWSSTGNTEAMANLVADGAKAKGAEVSLMTCAEFNASAAAGFDAVALGCPAMGDEVLEEGEFQPMWDDVKGALAGKKVGLFGSYGWGGGAWMQSWEDDAKGAGLNLASASVIACGAPDDAASDECKALGAALA